MEIIFAVIHCVCVHIFATKSVQKSNSQNVCILSIAIDYQILRSFFHNVDSFKMSVQYSTKAKQWKNRNITYEVSSLVRCSKRLLLHWMPVLSLLLIVVLQMNVSVPVVAQMQRTSTTSKATSTGSRTVSKTNTKATVTSSKFCYMCAGDPNAYITKPGTKVSIVTSLTCGQLYKNIGNPLYSRDCLRVSTNPTLQKLCGCSNVVANKLNVASTDSLNVIRTADTNTNVTPVVIHGARKVTIGPTVTYAPTVTFRPTRPPSVSPGPTITENPTNSKTLVPTLQVATIAPTRVKVDTFFPTSSRLPTITAFPLPTTNFPTVLAVTDEPTRITVSTFFPTSSRLPTITAFPLPTTNVPTAFAVTDEPTPQIFLQPQTWFPTSSPIPTASRLPTVTAQPTIELADINTIKPILGSPSMAMAPKKMLRMRMMKRLKMGSMMSSPGYSDDDDEWSSNKMTMMGKSGKYMSSKKDSSKIQTNPNRIMYKTMKISSPNPTTSPVVIRTDTAKSNHNTIKRTTNGQLHTIPTILRTMQPATRKRTIINIQSPQNTKTPVRKSIILVQPVLVQSRQVTPVSTTPRPLYVKNYEPTMTISRIKQPKQEPVPTPFEKSRSKPAVIAVASQPIPVQSRQVSPPTTITPYNSPTTKPIFVMQPIQVQSRQVSPPTTITPYNRPTTKPIIVMQPIPVQSRQVRLPTSAKPSFNIRSTTTLFQSKSPIKVKKVSTSSATTSRTKTLTTKPKPANVQLRTADTTRSKGKPTAPSLSTISAVLFQSSPSTTTLSQPTVTTSRVQSH